jgi:hypothetical protein
MHHYIKRQYCTFAVMPQQSEIESESEGEDESLVNVFTIYRNSRESEGLSGEGR